MEADGTEIKGRSILAVGYTSLEQSGLDLIFQLSSLLLFLFSLSKLCNRFQFSWIQVEKRIASISIYGFQTFEILNPGVVNSNVRIGIEVSLLCFHSYLHCIARSLCFHSLLVSPLFRFGPGGRRIPNLITARCCSRESFSVWCSKLPFGTLKSLTVFQLF